MKKLGYLTAALLLLLTLSCGGGGPTTPGTPDLAGLEGTWDYNFVITGNLSGDLGTLPMNEQFSGFYIIGRNSIVDDAGASMVWEYDGSTLILRSAYSNSEWDSDCGDEYFSGNFTQTIPIQAGATVGTLSGNMIITFLTEWCGDWSGTLQMAGNMTKR